MAMDSVCKMEVEENIITDIVGVESEECETLFHLFFSKSLNSIAFVFMA